MTETTTQKKSVWDVLDKLLPSATSVYGQIREQKTGVNPFQSSDSGFIDTKDEQLDMPQISFKERKNNTLLYVLGGVALIGLGVGTYFLIKKNK
jgi:hypothetical protein